MQQRQLVQALQRPASELGVLPQWATIRPKLNLHLYESLPSTNQEAWRLIDGNAGAGTVVIARQQTAGRGQWGRQWQSALGGLYLSLVLEPEMAIADTPLLTLASAWGIATSLENLGLSVAIKWPNDLVSNGLKVGGILTETRIASRIASAGADSYSQVQYAVIGVGLNWRNPLPPNAASVHQLLPDAGTSQVKTLEDLAAIALRGILQGYYFFRQQGRAALIEVYQHKLSHLGKTVTVNGHTAQVKGVTPTGSLLIEIVRESGRKTIQSLKPGEISLGYNV